MSFQKIQDKIKDQILFPEAADHFFVFFCCFSKEKKGSPPTTLHAHNTTKTTLSTNQYMQKRGKALQPTPQDNKNDVSFLEEQEIK
mmetsp:Transcript_36867/g.53991  ORF Transcript_36867/g.53991 Transcript_36867/m.53991 type:complete len:86 (-) Transcript_36867:620-877(-)